MHIAYEPPVRRPQGSKGPLVVAVLSSLSATIVVVGSRCGCPERTAATLAAVCGGSRHPGERRSGRHLDNLRDHRKVAAGTPSRLAKYGGAT